MSEAQFVYIAVAIDPAGSQCIDYAYNSIQDSLHCPFGIHTQTQDDKGYKIICIKIKISSGWGSLAPRCILKHLQ